MTAAKKIDRRSELMKKRMADPAFRAKALETLAKGRAARAAAKRKPDSNPGSIKPGSSKPEGGGPTQPAQPAAPPAAGTRSFGVGRWRGL